MRRENNTYIAGRVHSRERARAKFKARRGVTETHSESWKAVECERRAEPENLPTQLRGSPPRRDICRPADKNPADPRGCRSRDNPEVSRPRARTESGLVCFPRQGDSQSRVDPDAAGAGPRSPITRDFVGSCFFRGCGVSLE